MTAKQMLPIIPDNILVNKIYELRGLKVMLDSDLAELYGVETKVLNQSIRSVKLDCSHILSAITSAYSA